MPRLSAADLLAPCDGTPEAEIERLDQLADDPSVRLRRAYLRLSARDHRRALQELNRVLFGSPPATRSAQAWAYYLRARVYAEKGDEGRRDHDLAEAARLTSDEELARLLASIAPEARAPSAPASRALPHLERGVWGASAPVLAKMVPMRGVDRITLHHSAMLADNADSESRTGAIVRSIQKSHMHGRGWADIGYHYVIDRQGRVWEGRDIRWQGAHAGSPATNRGNLGVCLLGNFVDSRDGQHPSPPQLAAMQALVTDLCRRYRIPATRVLTHREIRPTACPGAHLQAAVEQLRSSMAGRAGAAARDLSLAADS